MWNPFRSKPLLSEENEFFQIETYKWLLTYFGGDNFYKGRDLILPTEEYFPAKISSPSEAANNTFEQVKKYAGLENWKCKLVVQEEDPNILVGDSLIVQNVAQNPHGTFSVTKKEEVVITYNPKLALSPTQMVATFSHELAHYLTSAAPEPPPGGWDNWEFATDITGSFLGFGVFLANSVFNFSQYSNGGSIGWQTSGGGYLSEAEHSYSLGLFLALKGIPPEHAYPHCDRNIKKLLKAALKEIENKSYVEILSEVKHVEVLS